jgi:acyl-CoA thioesterase I
MNNRPIIAAAFLTLTVGGALFLREYGVFGAIERPKYTVKTPDFRLPPQDRPLRVAVLGTSLSAANDWPAELERRLAACRTSPNSVTVHAKVGASSSWGLTEIDKALASRPDLLLIEFTANDASLWRGMPLRRSQKNHEAMIGRAKRAGVPVALMTMNPAHGAKAIARPGQAAYQMLYTKLAAVHGLALVDTWPFWEKMPENARKLNIPDGIHPENSAAKDALIPSILNVIGFTDCFI